MSRDPLELVLSEFTEEKRQGKTPSIEDFARRFPALADQIRELLPLIDNLEKWKGEKEVECLKRNVPKKFTFDRLGEYKLVRELGRGGMGVVFQAIHTQSQRSVAIKILPWRYAADMPVWKERFQREATTIAALKHPNIVPIYSFSEDQGYYYYVMQLVEGVGLDTIIKQLKQEREAPRSSRSRAAHSIKFAHSLTSNSWRGFAKIGEQVALALSYAHKHNVVHNDIKPSNLLLQTNGQVIVTDFGIGRLQGDESIESNEQAVGTLRYMPPERWDGKTGPSGDIYALGITLYELVTQSPVFRGPSRSELVEQIRRHDPVKPRQLVADLPGDLENVLLKAMAKDPKDRYETAHRFAEDLRRFVNRQPVHAKQKNMLQLAGTWWTKKVRAWWRRDR